MNLTALRDRSQELKIDFSPETLWGAYAFQYNNHLTKRERKSTTEYDFIVGKLIEYLEAAANHYGTGGGGRWNGKGIYKD